MEQVESDGLGTTQQLDQLAAALAAAQAEFPPIPKDRTATIRPRDKPAYSFKYADLADIFKAVRPALSKHGLSIVQVVNKAVLETVLLHSSGQRIASRVLLYNAQSEPKTFGAELSYLRRYALSALIGVATDDDIDEDGTEPGEPRSQKSETVRAPASKSESSKPAAVHAPASKAEDTGELATDGERAFLKKRAGDGLDDLLKRIGASSLEALTAEQFKAARSELVRAA